MHPVTSEDFVLSVRDLSMPTSHTKNTSSKYASTNEYVSTSWEAKVREIIATIGCFYKKNNLEENLSKDEKTIYTHLLNRSVDNLISTHVKTPQPTTWQQICNTITPDRNTPAELKKFIQSSPYIDICPDQYCSDVRGEIKPIREVTLDSKGKDLAWVFKGRELRKTQTTSNIEMLAVSTEMWNLLKESEKHPATSSPKQDCCTLV